MNNDNKKANFIRYKYKSLMNKELSQYNLKLKDMEIDDLGNKYEDHDLAFHIINKENQNLGKLVRKVEGNNVSLEHISSIIENGKRIGGQGLLKKVYSSEKKVFNKLGIQKISVNAVNPIIVKKMKETYGTPHISIQRNDSISLDYLIKKDISKDKPTNNEELCVRY